MKMLVVQHNDVEGPGYIVDWARSHDYQVKIVRPDQGANLNQIRPEQLDFLVVMGGNQSANDLGINWIIDERNLIKRVHAQKKPILGICLGAQQLAKSMGALIYKGTAPEIGWLPIQKSSQSPLNVPDRMVVLHWHQDDFTLPINSHRLFKSAVDVNQGFVLGNVIGLQFHLEITPDEVKRLVKMDHHFIDASDAPNAIQQSADQIVKTQFPTSDQKILDQLLDYLVK